METAICPLLHTGGEMAQVAVEAVVVYLLQPGEKTGGAIRV